MALFSCRWVHRVERKKISVYWIKATTSFVRVHDRDTPLALSSGRRRTRSGGGRKRPESWSSFILRAKQRAAVMFQVATVAASSVKQDEHFFCLLFVRWGLKLTETKNRRGEEEEEVAEAREWDEGKGGRRTTTKKLKYDGELSYKHFAEEEFWLQLWYS